MRVDPNYLASLATSIDQSSSNEIALTTELSSGLRVTSLQADPVAAAQSSILGSAIARDDTYVQGATGIQSMLQVTDSALAEVVTQITKAISLAVQGGNGTLSGTNAGSIGQQVSDLRSQILSLANTTYQGNYLFGGSQGASKPFALDTTTTPATVTYSGDTSVGSITTPSGQNIQTSVPGIAVFGDAATGVFAALNKLVADYASGTASANASSDTSALTNALTQVSTQRSILDSSLSRIQSTSTYFQTDASQLTAQQSTLVASDPATVATALKSAETQHQALLSVMNALGSVNLFSYLK